jgi:TusE/DsrC/DsvC family sulfur relay protein
MAMPVHHVEVKDKRYLVTDQNQLVDVKSWDHDIRDWLAEKFDVDLGEEHLKVIDFIRTVYLKRNQHPMPRVIVADLASSYGDDKGTLRYFYSLFPKGIHQAVSIAGVPLKGLCF